MNTKLARATIIFYDEEAQQLKQINIFRRDVQSAIDREMARGMPMTIPFPAEDEHTPLTDEDARKLGCMAFLQQASVFPEVRARLRITLAEPVNWDFIDKAPKP
jgi:hypothetical protein